MFAGNMLDLIFNIVTVSISNQFDIVEFSRHIVVN